MPPTQYSVNLSSNPSNGGITSGGGTYNSGSSVTVTATPNVGYTFTNWTENGIPVSSNNQYVFNVTNNIFLVANFSQIVSINNETNLFESCFLNQNYPNPFNPSTTISYTIANSGLVNLYVIDLTGKIVETLVNEYKSAGTHFVNFNAKNLPSGTYFYRIVSGPFTQTKKLLLIK